MRSQESFKQWKDTNFRVNSSFPWLLLKCKFPGPGQIAFIFSKPLRFVSVEFGISSWPFIFICSILHIVRHLWYYEKILISLSQAALCPSHSIELCMKIHCIWDFTVHTCPLSNLCGCKNFEFILFPIGYIYDSKPKCTRYMDTAQDYVTVRI